MSAIRTQHQNAPTVPVIRSARDMALTTLARRSHVRPLGLSTAEQPLAAFTRYTVAEQRAQQQREYFETVDSWIRYVTVATDEARERLGTAQPDRTATPWHRIAALVHAHDDAKRLALAWLRD